MAVKRLWAEAPAGVLRSAFLVLLLLPRLGDGAGLRLRSRGQNKEVAGNPLLTEAPFSCCDQSVMNAKQRKVKTYTGSTTFVLEWTGLEASGLMGQSSPSSDAAAQCLTASTRQNTLGGYALHLQTCESSLETYGPRSINNTDVGLLMMQQFTLSVEGTVRHAGTGLCVRRMRCGRLSTFDLGRCDGPGYLAIFQVQRPAANQISDLMPMGVALQAANKEQCVTCGPYVLTERCLSRGASHPTRNGPACGENWQAPLGFSKQASTYVGDAAATGRKHSDSVDSIGSRLWHQDEQKDMAGLAATTWDGICGSYVTDGPTLDSVWVLHRMPVNQFY